VAVVLAVVGLELNEHSLLANLSAVDTQVSACAVGAVEASPSGPAVARKMRAILFLHLSNLVDHLLVRAGTEVRTVAWTVSDTAVRAAVPGITPASSVDALAVTTALIRALRVRAVDSRMGIVADTGGRVAVAKSVTRAIVRASELGAVRTTEAGVAQALSAGKVAGSMSAAVVGAENLLASLTAETSSAEAGHVGAESTSIALVFALGL